MTADKRWQSIIGVAFGLGQTTGHNLRIHINIMSILMHIISQILLLVMNMAERESSPAVTLQ